MRKINWEAIGVGLMVVIAIATVGGQLVKDVAVIKVTQHRILEFMERHRDNRVATNKRVERNRAAIIAVGTAVKYYHKEALIHTKYKVLKYE